MLMWMRLIWVEDEGSVLVQRISKKQVEVGSANFAAPDYVSVLCEVYVSVCECVRVCASIYECI